MGLDEVGAAEVHRIMSEEGVSFDEVRLSLLSRCHPSHVALGALRPAFPPPPLSGGLILFP